MKPRKPPKFATPEALAAFRASLAAPASKDKPAPRQMLVCFGGSCLASGAREVRDALLGHVGPQVGAGTQVQKR